MRLIPRVLCSSAMLVSVAHASTFLDFLLPKHPLQVVTVTDVLPAGKKWRTVSPENPAYYVAVSGGYQDLGAPKGGERPVSPEEVTRTMQKVLAKQGYLPATKKHPPELILLWIWGSMNKHVFYFPSSIPGHPGLQINSGAMMEYMGGDKLGLGRDRMDPFMGLSLPVGLERRSDAAQTIYEAAQDDLYIAGVVAYDFQAAHVRREKEVLWRTRISCPSRGFWLPEALPSMLVIAGPFMGRETPKPVWIDASDKFRPEVILGDSKVLGYLDEADGPDASPAK